jgi:AraC-like DNA-binding protein
MIVSAWKVFPSRPDLALHPGKPTPDHLEDLPDPLTSTSPRAATLARATARSDHPSMQALLDQMCAIAARHTRDGRNDTPIPGLALMRASGPSGLNPGVFEPMFCLVLQGAKAVTIGERQLDYDPASYFIASLELPANGRIVEASPERPYLSLSLRLSRDGLAALLADVPTPPERAADAPGRSATTQGFDVSPVTADLLEPACRLLALLDAPGDIAVMAPLVERELLYRLLRGPQAATLRQIATADSRLACVRRAIGWIRRYYDQPLRIEDLAKLAGMSPASFHRHFRAATAMSPLQFQKSLRLQEARRLLVTSRSVAGAGFAVGYESASQFSREYARQFGAPPAKDAQRLRGDPALAAATGVV